VIKHTYEELKIHLTNPAITPKQKAKLCRLFYEFGDIFALSNEELPGTNRLQFKINIQQDTRLVIILIVKRKKWKLKNIKFIRHSVSPWLSNVLLVHKNNGEMRICINY